MNKIKHYTELAIIAIFCVYDDAKTKVRGWLAGPTRHFTGCAEDVINERELSVCRTPRLVSGSKPYTWCVSNGVAVGYGTTLDGALDAFEEDEYEKGAK